MKNITLALLVFFTQVIIAQQVCEGKVESNYIDINSISVKKCENKSSRAVIQNPETKSKVFSKRYLKKRKFSGEATRILNKTHTAAKNKIEGLAVLISESKIISKDENLVRSSIKNIGLTANKVNNKLTETQFKTQEDINLTNFKRTVSFAEVSNVPSFPMPNDNISFNQRMAEHIKVQLKYPQQALVNNIEGSVLVNFIINTNGEVINIKASSNDINNNILEKEAIRIIKALPKFIPGKHNGKKVNVSYGFPILFSMDY